MTGRKITLTLDGWIEKRLKRIKREGARIEDGEY